MAERSAHNRLVVGSIPTEPRTYDVLSEKFSVYEMLELLLGSDGKRKIRLRRKNNAELQNIYEAQLVLRHHNPKGLSEAKRIVGLYFARLKKSRPDPENAAAFLAQFASLKPRTLYRYHSIIKVFMEWYGEKLDTNITVPETLPGYVEISDIEKLKEAVRSKKTHKGLIARDLLIIDLACKTGLRREELSNLLVRDISIGRGYLEVILGKGQKDRIVDIAPSIIPEIESFLKGKQPDEKVFGLAASSISGLIHWAAKRAGVDIHTHSLRHFFGQSLVDRNTDLETVRRLMGHSSLRTTQQYLGRTDKQRRDAILKLDQPVDPPEQNGSQWSSGPML